MAAGVSHADHRELIMDILKFGADVEVLAPPDLRQRVADEAAKMTRMYAPAKPDSVPRNKLP